ncbi:hypothetical protein E1B28_010514 [Marasmius oreades]|uniref:Uncharacterized protein n=1 Tax=Marasmius oreades TaxID=181124 RepID=A0A9P7RYR4_9AGAR|nr:uncharacterized protein E1B28_010514 [Marasmius oreades]KAG7091483.1 hypothetical protein E1B28_010514 [Marasmius oreades]
MRDADCCQLLFCCCSCFLWCGNSYFPFCCRCKKRTEDDDDMMSTREADLFKHDTHAVQSTVDTPPPGTYRMSIERPREGTTGEQKNLTPSDSMENSRNAQSGDRYSNYRSRPLETKNDLPAALRPGVAANAVQGREHNLPASAPPQY